MKKSCIRRRTLKCVETHKKTTKWRQNFRRNKRNGSMKGIKSSNAGKSSRQISKILIRELLCALLASIEIANTLNASHLTSVQPVKASNKLKISSRTPLQGEKQQKCIRWSWKAKMSMWHKNSSRNQKKMEIRFNSSRKNTLFHFSKNANYPWHCLISTSTTNGRSSMLMILRNYSVEGLRMCQFNITTQSYKISKGMGLTSSTCINWKRKIISG